MKLHVQLLSVVMSALTVSAWAQCSSPNLKPVWEAEKGQFRCIDPTHPGDSAKDETVQPTGDKETCAAARDNLQAVCPPSGEGKACRSQAKSIYNACKRGKGEAGSSSSPSSTSFPAKTTDSATCMTNFQQQQLACNSRRLPPPAPGQMSPPDTCLQDAMAEQRRCLANSR
ncbi:hypothetical protein [Edaphobacter aggregans]|uniref:hypothetical protein n=1 Tax=Edaphobacter aggregans TaxID=570835 RepID=UPI00054E9504|nr:hypothetical protein [Edaphobacter aggregans]